jgi:hypothetical protein
MRVHRLIPIAALAFAVACSDDATSPSSVNRPLFDVSPGTFGNEVTFTSANTPGGTHIQSGAISCTVNADLSISCTGYELAGVGHTNVDVSLTATYSADVACNNPAGGKNRNNDIEPHATTFDANDSFTAASLKNGRLTVRSADVSPGTVSDEELCPNGNWIPEITNLTLESFSYTVTFEGFSSPAVLISQP